MSVTVKRDKWLVGIYKTANGTFQARFTDNKEFALKFNNLSAAVESIKKLTDYSFDEWSFYEDGKFVDD